MEEPPVLHSSDGEQIVIHRRPDGSFFSNHPEYEVRLALHQDQLARDAAAAAQAEAEFDDQSGPEAEDGDGEVAYEEMAAKELVALARERKLTLPSPAKRADVIALLRQNDESRA